MLLWRGAWTKLTPLVRACVSIARVCSLVLALHCTDAWWGSKGNGTFALPSILADHATCAGGSERKHNTNSSFLLCTFTGGTRGHITHARLSLCAHTNFLLS